MNVYFGLTKKLAKKLEDLAKKQRKTESATLRQILERYLEDKSKEINTNTENRSSSYQPLKKCPHLGLKHLPRTITKEQDTKLRKLAEKTGRTISGMVREAVEKS